MNVIGQFSRKSIKEQLTQVLNSAVMKTKVIEDEEGTLVDPGQGPEDSATVGPVDLTGVKAAAAQAVSGLLELVKQCTTIGVATVDYEDMVSDIQSQFGLPGGTVDVGSGEPSAPAAPGTEAPIAAGV